MKSRKLSFEELIQLVKNQLEQQEDKFKYSKEFRELYRMCKKSIVSKIKSKLKLLKKYVRKK